ncbi:MAG: hypothetical protein WBW92_09425 [Rhodanobacteraceae bacterium]
MAQKLRIGIFVILGPPQAEPGIHWVTSLHGATHQNQNGFIRNILSLTLRAIGYADVRFRQSCLGVRIAVAQRPG